MVVVGNGGEVGTPHQVLAAGEQREHAALDAVERHRDNHDPHQRMRAHAVGDQRGGDEEEDEFLDDRPPLVAGEFGHQREIGADAERDEQQAHQHRGGVDRDAAAFADQPAGDADRSDDSGPGQAVADAPHQTMRAHEADPRPQHDADERREERRRQQRDKEDGQQQ